MYGVREALGELVRELYRRQQVKLVHTCNPDASLRDDFGISAQLHSGAFVEFWIDIEWSDSSWQLNYSVLRRDPDEDSPHTVRSFPAQTIYSAHELTEALVAAVESLRDSSSDDSLYT